MNKLVTATSQPAIAHHCQVLDVSPLSRDTVQVVLQSLDRQPLDYYAGQHLQLELDVKGDGQMQSLSYSIANSFNPAQPGRLQLFIQHGSAFAAKIVRRLTELRENNTALSVVLPMGRAYLQTDLDLPHVLIAAGSGIAKIKAITEAILSQRPDSNLHIYWSNRHTEEFYLLDLFQSWDDQHANLQFTPILESASADWSGRSGYLYETIREDFDDLRAAQVYLCGSPQMVYGTIDKLKATGLKESNCYSDVFDYAPREQQKAV